MMRLILILTNLILNLTINSYRDMDVNIIQAKINVFLCVCLAVCLLVILAIMLDLWDGVYTAKRTGQKIHSHKLRITIDKMSEYWRFLIIGFLIDCMGILFECYKLPFMTILFGVGLIAVETKSMFEHAKRRKSHTAELPDLIKRIIECAHEGDAEKLIEELENRETKLNKGRR